MQADAEKQSIKTEEKEKIFNTTIVKSWLKKHTQIFFLLGCQSLFMKEIISNIQDLKHLLYISMRYWNKSQEIKKLYTTQFERKYW